MLDKNEKLLTQKEVARMLGLSPRTLEAQRLRGGGIPYIELSKRCIRYRLTVVENFLKCKERLNTTFPA